MKLCFRFVAKLSTKMQNETQFLINFIVKINIKKFQQFFKTDFSTPLTQILRGPNSAPGRPGGVIYCSFFPGGLHAVADHLQAPAGALTTNFTAVILGEFNPHMAQKFCAA